MKKPSLIAIVGPTASGKTEFSIKLAKKIGGEIVSADSRLVYKGFNTVCAKPTLKERCGIPHYMMDLIGVDDIETRKKKMNEVTKEEVIKVAKKIHLNTIYLLEGDKDEEN